MRYAYLFFEFMAQSPAEWALFAELLLHSLAAVAFLKLVRVLWRFLCAWFRSMASMMSWALALMALAFLVVRLVRFFA